MVSTNSEIKGRRSMQWGLAEVVFCPGNFEIPNPPSTERGHVQVNRTRSSHTTLNKPPKLTWWGKLRHLSGHTYTESAERGTRGYDTMAKRRSQRMACSVGMQMVKPDPPNNPPPPPPAPEGARNSRSPCKIPLFPIGDATVSIKARTIIIVADPAGQCNVCYG